MSSCKVTMKDGWSEWFGYGKLKDIYEHAASINQAISKIDEVIQELERCQQRLDPVPGKVEELWGDYWATERLMSGFGECDKKYEKTIDRLKTARDDLERILEAAKYCKQHNWFKKSSSQQFWDGFKKVGSLGASGSFSDSKDSSYP